MRPDRLEQQVAVRADAAAEHDQRDVGDGGDRHDVERDPPRDLGDHACATGSPRRARRRTPRARRRAAPATVAAPGAAAAPRRSALTALAHGSTSCRTPTQRRSISPAAPWWPRCSSPREHEPGADAGADREEREVVHAARDAAPLLADGGEVDVVLERHRQARGAAAARRRAPRPRARTPPARLIVPSSLDDARHADDAPSIALAAAVAPRAATRSRSIASSTASRRRRAARRPGARGSRRRGRRSRRAGSGRRRRGRARAPPRAPARRTPRRSSARPGAARPRAPGPPRAATAARGRRSAWRCPPAARSPRARSARPRGSPPARCAR